MVLWIALSSYSLQLEVLWRHNMNYEKSTCIGTLHKRQSLRSKWNVHSLLEIVTSTKIDYFWLNNPIPFWVQFEWKHSRLHVRKIERKYPKGACSGIFSNVKTIYNAYASVFVFCINIFAYKFVHERFSYLLLIVLYNDAS